MYDLRWVLVDTGSSVNLITLDAFNKLGLDQNNLAKVLGDKTIAVPGTINLHLVLGYEKHKWDLFDAARNQHRNVISTQRKVWGR